MSQWVLKTLLWIQEIVAIEIFKFVGNLCQQYSQQVWSIHIFFMQVIVIQIHLDIYIEIDGQLND